jgi:hypothetical protein
VEPNSFHEQESFSTQQVVAVGKGGYFLHCLFGFWIQLHAAIFNDSTKIICDYTTLNEKLNQNWISVLVTGTILTKLLFCGATND